MIFDRTMTGNWIDMYEVILLFDLVSVPCDLHSLNSACKILEF
jgi:hypothetical protein